MQLRERNLNDLPLLALLCHPVCTSGFLSNVFCASFVSPIFVPSPSTTPEQYMVDTIDKRYIIKLGRTDAVEYDSGANTMVFEVKGMRGKDAPVPRLYCSGRVFCLVFKEPQTHNPALVPQHVFYDRTTAANIVCHWCLLVSPSMYGVTHNRLPCALIGSLAHCPSPHSLPALLRTPYIIRLPFASPHLHVHALIQPRKPPIRSHQVDRIDVSGIKPSRLANAGLLIATLFSEDTEIIEVKLVVQVSQEEKGGSFTRCIFNPLE